MRLETPAGYYPLSAMFPHVVAAGTVLLCAVCGRETHAPIPRLDPRGYGRACEAWLREHRDCAATADSRGAA